LKLLVIVLVNECDAHISMLCQFARAIQSGEAAPEDYDVFFLAQLLFGAFDHSCSY
jgi:hypothetical protein